MSLRILGGGGHAKVALEAWRSGGGEVRALHDDRPELQGRTILGITIVGSLADAIASTDPVHVAIGDNAARSRIAGSLEDERCPRVVHSGSQVSPTARLGAGILVCAGAVIQAEASIGRHTIVNSLALVEHDVEIGSFCHIAPGVRLGGAARIATGALIGIGAVVLPGIQVGRDAVVGAGAVVIRDVPDSAIFVGNPARAIARA